MYPASSQFKEDRNTREFGGFKVVVLPDGKTALQRPGATGTEGILPRDIAMSGDELAKMKKNNDN